MLDWYVKRTQGYIREPNHPSISIIYIQV
jgi:hypothetical protein